MRPAVAILIFKATGGDDPEKVIKVASAFELIHSATLIHDDINDHRGDEAGKAGRLQEIRHPKGVDRR